jgi:hypothetical protein
VKGEHHIWTYLRQQLHGHPELRQRPIDAGWGIGQRCFACGELIREEDAGASRYHCPGSLGQVHWFHPECEAILEKARHPRGRDLVEERRRQDSSHRKEI